MQNSQNEQCEENLGVTFERLRRQIIVAEETYSAISVMAKQYCGKRDEALRELSKAKEVYLKFCKMHESSGEPESYYFKKKTAPHRRFPSDEDEF